MKPAATNPPPTQSGPTSPPHQGGYPPQQGGYPPQQGGYPPPQQGYPPQQGGYPPPQQGYPPQQGGYPPPQQGYPPQQGGYPPPQQGYPPQQGGYPPPQHGYPPQQGGYPPPQGGHAPPPQHGYPPQQGGYPPPQQGYPPQQGGYPPPQQGYPPQQGGYPPPQHGYPPQQGGYPPPAGYAPPPVGGVPPTGQIPTTLVAPPGSRFTADAHPSLKIHLISAQNLEAADLNGKSDPFCKFHNSNYTTTSRTINKNLNPTWNEHLTLNIHNPQFELLVLEVYDKDPLSNDLLGFVGIDLSLLPKGREVITTEKLTHCKHGVVQIGLTAQGFGLENYPPDYPDQYVRFRNAITVKPKDKHKKKDKSKSKTAKTAAHGTGPFHGKHAPSGYTIKDGQLKKKKTEAQKGKEGAIKAGKGLVSFAKGLI